MPQIEALAPAAPPGRSARAPVLHPVTQVRGLVSLPSGATEDPSGIRVEARGSGAESFHARVHPDRTFVFHLPADSYTLTAVGEAWVGEIKDVGCAGDQICQVDIAMKRAASIRGTLRGLKAGRAGRIPAGGVVYRSGDKRPVVQVTVEEDGRFAVDQLLPDALYDLRIETDGSAGAFARAVRAPTSGLQLVLTPPPTLLGAVGAAPGAECPAEVIEIRDGQDFIGNARVDARCRFRASNLPRGRDLAVVARGEGWFVTAEVTTPEQGDPAPLCFNPPCRELPSRESASLAVVFDGAPAEAAVSVEASPHEEAGEAQGCQGEGSGCTIEGGLPVGTPLNVQAYSEECSIASTHTTLRAGHNSVRLTCRRTRAVEGALRLTGRPNPPGAWEVNGETGPPPTVIRCAGDDDSATELAGAFIFRLRCPADQSAVEYRLQPDEPWRTAAVPSGDPAWVEIHPGGAS